MRDTDFIAHRLAEEAMRSTGENFTEARRVLIRAIAEVGNRQRVEPLSLAAPVRPCNQARRLTGLGRG